MKITLTDLANLQNETTAVAAINANNAALEIAFDNTLSRDSSAPNPMEASLDMNNHRILNLPSPSSPLEPVTLNYLNGITPGVISGVSSVSTYASRALAAAAHIPVTTVVVQTGGYASSGDGGGGLYNQVSAPQIGSFQSADGQNWAPDFSRGINIRLLGAGLGNGVNDVAAMTAALNASISVGGGVSTGYNILLTSGSAFDFSTGQFLINKNGTRILGENNRTCVVHFNPASPAALFTFYNAGDLTGGLSNCECSNFEVISANSIQKTIFTLSNTSDFLIDRMNLQSITGGNSIGLLYQGRNLLVMKDCTVNADLPVFFFTNPDRANYGNEDADYITFERNQLNCLSAGSACYTVSNGLNITNWIDRDSDWALGRYGVLNADSTSTVTSYTWRFEGVRREQEQGVNPTMFAILRSGSGIVRNLQIINCAVGTGALFNLTGIERVDIQDTTVFPNNVLIGTADNTVSALKWSNLFCQSGCTLSLGTGLNLVKGRELRGGTTSSPIYLDATYTNSSDGAVEWLGPPSTNGRRMGIWRVTQDVPVFTGANQLDLYPFSHYTVQYAKISVTTASENGVVDFATGETPPTGCTVLLGTTNFKVDGAANHLSVFHFGDSSVGIINKLASALPMTVEVLFTI